jgi:MFS family permease
VAFFTQTMNSWKELAKLPRRIWILSAAALINRAGTMALPFLTLYLVKEIGMTPGRAGAMLGLYGAVALLAGPVAGRLCDRVGTRPMMLWCLALSGVAMLLFPLAKTEGRVAALLAFWSLTSEGFRPAIMAAVSESAPESMRKQAYALNRLAVNIGMSLGPALGGFLAAFSFKSIWLVDGATSLAAALVLRAALPPAPARATRAEGAAVSAQGLLDPRLRFAILAALPVSLVFFQHEGALPVHLVSDLGLSPSFYGLLFTINTAVIVALEVPINHATAHWSDRRTLSLGSALFAAGFGLYGLADARWEIAAATVVWTFGEMVLMPGLTAYISGISPEERRGEYMGLYLMGFSLAFMAGPWAGLWALEHWGSGPLWAASFFVGMASAALFAKLPKGKLST